MKSTTLNVDSWHYKLASTFGYDPDFKKHDICTYLRRVLLGFAISTILVGFGIGITSLVSILLVNLVLGPWFYFMYGVPFNEFAFLSWLLLIVGGSLVGLIYARAAYVTYRHRRWRARKELENSEDYTPPEAGFLKLAYQSYKDKFCLKLDFVDKTGQKYETRTQRKNREWREQLEADMKAEQNEKPIESTGKSGEPTTGDAP